MKDRADLESALKLELIHWRTRQIKDVYGAYYLYYTVLGSLPVLEY